MLSVTNWLFYTPINMELLCSDKICDVQYVIKEAYLKIKDKSNTIGYVTVFFIVLKEFFQIFLQ